MAFSLNETLRNARADAITSAVGSAGKIKIYNGVRPSTVSDPLSGNTLLAELNWVGTMAPAAASGTLTINTPADEGSAPAAGQATWARITTSLDVAILDCSVTATGGGGDIELSSDNISLGAVVSLTGGTIVEGDI